MYINLILIPFILLLGLLMSYDDTKHQRGLYIVIISIVLILVAALRSPEWMTGTYMIDTLHYQNEFDNIFNTSWSEYRMMAYQRYFGNEGDYDIGFLFLTKFIGTFTRSYYLYSIIMDLIFFIPLGIILYRYCTEMRQIIFAYVFYVALIQIFLFAGARQVFAMGFDLIALLFVIDRKKWKALIFFLLGLTIHFSSLLFLAPLLMVWFDTKPRTLKIAHIMCFIVFPLVLLFPNQFIVFMGEVSGVEKYASYGMGSVQGGANTFVLLIEVLSLFILVAIKRNDMIKDETLRNFYVMTPFFTLLAPLIQSNGSMIRISMYFHLFLMVLVPYSINCAFNKQNRIYIYIAAILGLSFLALQGGGIRYYFFWQV